MGSGSTAPKPATIGRHNSEILKIPKHLINCYNTQVLSPVCDGKERSRDKPYEYFAIKASEKRSDSLESQQSTRTRHSLKRRPYV